MEIVLDELKQFTVKKVNNLTDKNKKYLLVLYLLSNYTKCYSLVYIENPDKIDCDMDKTKLTYPAPSDDIISITDPIPSFDIYELEYDFNINKFIEIKNNICNQFYNNEVIYYYQNPKIYYMFSKFDYDENWGAMYACRKRRIK